MGCFNGFMDEPKQSSWWVILVFFSVKSGGPPTLAHICDCPFSPPTGDTDVFGATSAPSLKEPQKHEQPTAGQSPYLAAPTGLFDDTDDDDTFFAASSSKSSMTGTCSCLFFGNVARRRMST